MPDTEIRQIISWLRRCHGLALRRLRERTGLTQEDLAARLGLTRQAVQQWEAGEWSPGFARERRIAEVLGLTAAEVALAGRPGNDIEDGTDPEEVLRLIGLPEPKKEEV